MFTTRLIVPFFLLPLFGSISSTGQAGPGPHHDLRFTCLAATWDEGIPLGNGSVGVLIWSRQGRIRMSLDRADLWDERPIPEFETKEFKFSWVVRQVQKGEYEPVQRLFDLPYDRDPAPTRIPAAALEFDTIGLGPAVSVRLDIAQAVCTVVWASGATLTAFVHATLPIGWYRFEHVPPGFSPALVPPPYTGEGPEQDAANDVVDGQDLKRLKYPAPVLTRSHGSVLYTQAGHGKFLYEVACRWTRPDETTLEGVWSISAHPSYMSASTHAVEQCSTAIERSLLRDRETHMSWWQKYWAASSVSLPDSLLERQWFLEMYKFGSVARRGSPPITLQGVWTADNAKIPPWKGDIHNDLNTQLSYWPAYAGNHLEEELSFLDWLWKCRPAFHSYTRTFFGTAGLNVPGVTTLAGKPMGGWIQYSFSPTIGAWLAHHFYLHWRYSMDRTFLEQRAYPWVKEVAAHLLSLSTRGPDGLRSLPLSSSPEINDNRIDAWFHTITNYDLALIRWIFGAAAELAAELGLPEEESRWRAVLSEWPPLARSPTDGRLLVAEGVPLKESHRHFSHLMAIHPLGILDWQHGESDRTTILASLRDLERLGPDLWVGYSYSWLASMYARAGNGEKAADALRTFARCFCLENSFHVNGDQTKSGKSRFTYRPFTLEGNFAFAEAIHEMLLQSQNGCVRIFPALPKSWEEAEFSTLRAEGAFLVSAVRSRGLITRVSIHSEQGGPLRLENPFGDAPFRVDGIKTDLPVPRGRFLEFNTGKGETITLTAQHRRP